MNPMNNNNTNPMNFYLIEYNKLNYHNKIEVGTYAEERKSKDIGELICKNSVFLFLN